MRFIPRRDSRLEQLVAKNDSYMPKRVYFLAFGDLLGEHVCIRFTTVIKEYAFPLEWLEI